MKDQIKQMMIDGINSWTDEDIYAVSLFVYDDEDDPSKPTVTLGYNTERQVQEALKTDFTDEDEARWNYAFWLQNSCFVFGEDDTAEAVRNWVIANGFDHVDDDDADMDDEEYDEDEASEITSAFVDMLVEIVQEIHEEKVLTLKFGRELPILIHELEYYDEIAEQNIRANGEELAGEFAQWCMYC